MKSALYHRNHHCHNDYLYYSKLLFFDKWAFYSCEKQLNTYIKMMILRN